MILKIRLPCLDITDLLIISICRILYDIILKQYISREERKLITKRGMENIESTDYPLVLKIRGPCLD